MGLDFDLKSMIIGIGVVLVFILILAVSLMFNVLSMRDALVNTFFVPTTAQVTNTRTIVTSLQPLGQIVSLSVEVAQADINVTVNSGAMNICGHSANHVAQGVIEAGVDITQVDDDSISYNNFTNTYTITLPAPQITSCRIEYIRQYEQSGGNPTCGIDWDSVRLLGQYVSTVEFSEDVLAGGILERAARETTTLMRAFVAALTGSNVEIVFAESSAEPILPPSCVPQLPNGWSLDETTGQWVFGQ